MANLTKARGIQRGDGVIRPYKLAAATKVWAGAILAVNTTTGLATNASDATGIKAVGVVDKTVDSAVTPKTNARVWARGVINFACSGADQTWVGKQVFAVDNQTVALSTTNSVLVGRVTEVISATQVFVALTVD